MIPGFLERAILNGWAEFKTISHAFSSFGTLPIPDNNTVIITHIKWFPFLNPILKTNTTGLNATTWRDVFKYIEYQLKIDGKKSRNYLQYRNEFDFKFFGNSGGTNGIINFDTSGIISGISNGTENGTVTETAAPPPPFTATTTNAVTDTINLNANSNSLGAFSINGTPLKLDDIINFESEEWLNFLPLMKKPIQQDVYFVCEEFIKLTVTRNVFIDKINTVFGLLQPKAAEENAPSGLKNTNVFLRGNFISPGGLDQYYFPGGIANDGNDVNDLRKMQNYIQDIDKDYSGISDFDTNVLINNLPQRFPYQSSPLIEFGIVTINNKYWDKIKSS